MLIKELLTILQDVDISEERSEIHFLKYILTIVWTLIIL